MSFSCEHCGYENNEIQSGGPVSEKAVQITLCVETLPDLNRQVVKSDYTSIKIPELDFEIPSKSQKGGWFLFKKKISFLNFIISFKVLLQWKVLLIEVSVV